MQFVHFTVRRLFVRPPSPPKNETEETYKAKEQTIETVAKSHISVLFEWNIGRICSRWQDFYASFQSSSVAHLIAKRFVISTTRMTFNCVCHVYDYIYIFAVSFAVFLFVCCGFFVVFVEHPQWHDRTMVKWNKF